MTNLKMVFPEVNLIPSGGITEQNVVEFIKCGACAVSGARTFMNFEMIEKRRNRLGYKTGCTLRGAYSGNKKISQIFLNLLIQS